MQILSRYILKEHLPPFLFSFFIITVVLILETIPRLVDLVIDKDVSPTILIELVFLNLAWMLALSAPMACLVSTLAAFGRLSSDFEILAIKASGINLLRLLLPLLAAATIMATGLLKFNDTILPELNHKARMLMGDIRAMRPTLIFTPGLFVDDIRGYIILLDHINHRTSEVRGVRINDVRSPDQPTLIIADHGVMEFIDDGSTIKFTLFDGEIHDVDLQNEDNYRRVQFTKQLFYVTDIGSRLERTESDFRTDREMNITEMREYVDRIEGAMEPIRNRASSVHHTGLSVVFPDSAQRPDSTEALGDSARIMGFRAQVAGVSRQIQRATSQLEEQEKLVSKYLIEIYKKYSIAFAPLAFVLFGAPLAILSRRAGMGFSIGISILLFIVYWGFLIGGEDLADRGLAQPFWAMWSANILVGSIGLYLLFLAVTEKRFFFFIRRSN